MNELLGGGLLGFNPRLYGIITLGKPELANDARKVIRALRSHVAAVVEEGCH